jgi:hypothetical protein
MGNMVDELPGQRRGPPAEFASHAPAVSDSHSHYLEQAKIARLDSNGQTSVREAAVLALGRPDLVRESAGELLKKLDGEYARMQSLLLDQPVMGPKKAALDALGTSYEENFLQAGNLLEMLNRGEFGSGNDRDAATRLMVNFMSAAESSLYLQLDQMVPFLEKGQKSATSGYEATGREHIDFLSGALGRGALDASFVSGYFAWKSDVIYYGAKEFYEMGKKDYDAQGLVFYGPHREFASPQAFERLSGEWNDAANRISAPVEGGHSAWVEGCFGIISGLSESCAGLEVGIKQGIQRKINVETGATSPVFGGLFEVPENFRQDALAWNKVVRDLSVVGIGAVGGPVGKLFEKLYFSFEAGKQIAQGDELGGSVFLAALWAGPLASGLRAIGVKSGLALGAVGAAGAGAAGYMLVGMGEGAYFTAKQMADFGFSSQALAALVENGIFTYIGVKGAAETGKQVAKRARAEKEPGVGQQADTVSKIREAGGRKASPQMEEGAGEVAKRIRETGRGDEGTVEDALSMPDEAVSRATLGAYEALLSKEKFDAKEPLNLQRFRACIDLIVEEPGAQSQLAAIEALGTLFSRGNFAPGEMLGRVAGILAKTGEESQVKALEQFGTLIDAPMFRVAAERSLRLVSAMTERSSEMNLANALGALRDIAQAGDFSLGKLKEVEGIVAHTSDSNLYIALTCYDAMLHSPDLTSSGVQRGVEILNRIGVEPKSANWEDAAFLAEATYREISPSELQNALWRIPEDVRQRLLNEWTAAHDPKLQRPYAELREMVLNVGPLARTESQSPGIAAKLCRENGISHFGRWSAQMLESQLLPRDESKPLAVVLYPQADNNGAFYHDAAKIDALREHYDVRVIEAGSKREAVGRLNRIAREYGGADGISALVLGGHGTEGMVQLGGKEGEFIRVGDLVGAPGMQRWFAHDAGGNLDVDVIFVSCSTGKEGGIVEQASQAYPGVRMKGPKVPTHLKEITFETDAKTGKKRPVANWADEGIGAEYHQQPKAAVAGERHESRAGIRLRVLGGEIEIPNAVAQGRMGELGLELQRYVEIHPDSPEEGFVSLEGVGESYKGWSSKNSGDFAEFIGYLNQNNMPHQLYPYMGAIEGVLQQEIGMRHDNSARPNRYIASNRVYEIQVTDGTEKSSVFVKLANVAEEVASHRMLRELGLDLGYRMFDCGGCVVMQRAPGMAFGRFLRVEQYQDLVVEDIMQGGSKRDAFLGSVARLMAYHEAGLLDDPNSQNFMIRGDGTLGRIDVWGAGFDIPMGLERVWGLWSGDAGLRGGLEATRAEMGMMKAEFESAWGEIGRNFNSNRGEILEAYGRVGQRQNGTRVDAAKVVERIEQSLSRDAEQAWNQFAGEKQ